MSDYKQYNYSGPDELYNNFSGRYTTLLITDTGIMFNSSSDKNAKVSGMLLSEKIQGHKYKTYIIRVVAAALSDNAQPYIYTGFSQNVEDRVIIGPPTEDGNYLEYSVQFTLPKSQLFDFGVCFSQKNIMRHAVAVNSISLSCMEDDYYVLTHKDTVINSNKDFNGNSITVKKIILDQIEPTGNLNLGGNGLNDVGGITLIEDINRYTLSISNAELVIDNSIILTDSNYPSYINNIMRNPAVESLAMNDNDITFISSISFNDLSNPGTTGFVLNVDQGNLNFEGNVIPHLDITYGDVNDLVLTNLIPESVFIMGSVNGIDLCATGMATFPTGSSVNKTQKTVQFPAEGGSATSNYKIGNGTIFSIASYTINNYIELVFTINATRIYAFFIKKTGGTYECGCQWETNTVGYTSINGNLPISVLYKNGTFMPYVGTNLMSNYIYQSPIPNAYYTASIYALEAATFNSPNIKCASSFGVPIAMTTMPSISINDAFNISMSVPLIQVYGPTAIIPNTESNKFHLRLGIQDSVGRELIGNTGSFIPAFDITNSSITANNAITYNYISDPINNSDNIYNIPWNTGLTGPYALTAYMNVNNIVCATNTGITGATGAIMYNTVYRPENITSENLSDYISNSDINIGTHNITCGSINANTEIIINGTTISSNGGILSYTPATLTEVGSIYDSYYNQPPDLLTIIRGTITNGTIVNVPISSNLNLINTTGSIKAKLSISYEGLEYFFYDNVIFYISKGIAGSAIMITYPGTPTKFNNIVDATVSFTQTSGGECSFQLLVSAATTIIGNYTFSYSIISGPNVV